ncbi:MAG: ATP-binding cassette domain-containing protein, partial [Planctomycetaceae bacterium]
KSATNAREIAHLMVGRELSVRQRRLSAGVDGSSEPVLRVQNLSLPWAGRRGGWRLRDVSFSVGRGEIVGLAGLMGAGRTELLECLAGASGMRYSGEVWLRGERSEFRHPADALRAGVAMATEDRKRLGLFRGMTVRENITISALPRFSGAGVISVSREQEAVREQTESLGIRTAGSEALVTSLSGGNQQKCMLARCLLTKPDVLLLDDPTRGVDVGAKGEIYRIIADLARRGLACIVISSELPEVIGLSHRVIVLRGGEVAGELP